MLSLHPESGGGLGDAARRRLLALAREALDWAAREEKVWPPPAPETIAALLEPRACFVTLHKTGMLRGCVGQMFARLPLYLAVVEAAYSAAREDPRFPALVPEELSEIEVEISVLSPFRPIKPEEVEVGRHGLLLTRDRARGVLLPQVPTEYGWDRARFLSEICRKAGLEAEAWMHGASLQAFTAEVFGKERTGPGGVLH